MFAKMISLRIVMDYALSPFTPPYSIPHVPPYVWYKYNLTLSKKLFIIIDQEKKKLYTYSLLTPFS